ncbi:MAG: TlpA family protein disulfide reductase [Oligoflexia bacterium]|nr:TlpA family protein disulfide reductase [Oligoflexia bacterium]
MQAGDLAPNFKGFEIGGRPFSLSDYRGQVVLLNFWATWCAVCKSEMPMFEEIQHTFAGEPFTVLAVSIDQDAGAVRRFAEENDFSFPLALDLNHSAERAYKVQALPLSLLINKEGRMVYFGSRTDARIATRIEGAADWNGADVIQQIRSLL